jgi:hypothetical protein
MDDELQRDDLNGVQLEAVAKILSKLDKLTLSYGTHLVGMAKFKVYDEAANAAEVVIDFSTSSSMHYLLGSR